MADSDPPDHLFFAYREVAIKHTEELSKQPRNDEKIIELRSRMEALYHLLYPGSADTSGPSIAGLAQQLGHIVERFDRLDNILEPLVALFDPFESSQSEASADQNRKRRSDFKLALHNHYSRRRDLQLPQFVQCLITGLQLPASLVVAGHLIQKSNTTTAQYILGVDDVWDVRNGMLWCHPVERAYTLKHLVLLPHSPTEFIVRIVTDSCMEASLADFATDGQAKVTLAFRNMKFKQLDNRVVDFKDAGAVPFRRVVVAHAAQACLQHRGNIRANLDLKQSDFVMDSPYYNKTRTLEWLRATLNTAEIAE